MQKAEMIKQLRDSMFIIDPTVDRNEYSDPEYMKLSDSFMENVLSIALSRVSPEDELEDMKNEDLFPVMLLARKEVYFYLATKSAPLYDLSVAGSAGSSKVSREQRFQHYMLLIRQVEQEYQNYLEGIFITGGGSDGGIGAGELLISSRYFSVRNYELAKRPSIKAKVDYVYKDKVDISWVKIDVNRFNGFEIFLSETPIVDEYTIDIVDKTKRIQALTDKHRTKFKIEGLTPETTYYVAVTVKELNGLIGYSEVSFTTLEE